MRALSRLSLHHPQKRYSGRWNARTYVVNLVGVFGWAHKDNVEEYSTKDEAGFWAFLGGQIVEQLHTTKHETPAAYVQSRRTIPHQCERTHTVSIKHSLPAQSPAHLRTFPQHHPRGVHQIIRYLLTLFANRRITLNP